MILFTLFISATVLSYLFSRVVQRSAIRRGAIVSPHSDRWNRRSTPTFGGVAIVATSVILSAIVLLLSGLIDEVITSSIVMLAALAMFLVGMADDNLQLTPLAKLVASLVVGAFFVFGLNLPGVIPAWVAVLSIVWFSGIVHALNLLDNMDGLAAGVALAACLFLAVAFGVNLGPMLVAVLVVVGGSLLGFLVWNRHPARLFMGDCGSLFIGAILASASLVPIIKSDAPLFFNGFIASLILVVPLFDTGFVLILRRMAGRKATRGGTDHVSHRLVSLGFSERSAVRILYVFGLVGGALAVSLSLGGSSLLPIAGLFIVGIILAGIYLARVPAYKNEDFLALQKSALAPFLQDLAFRWHVGQVLLDVLLVSSMFYAAYLIRFSDDALGQFLPSFAASLPIVLACKLVALYLSGLYSRSWSTFGLRDLYVVAYGVGGGSILSILAAAYVFRFELFSRGVFLIDALLLFTAVVATRASFRLMGEAAVNRSKKRRRVLIYGAGSGGQLLAREMRVNRHWMLSPVGFLDDDPKKQLRWILGLPVGGGVDELKASLGRYRAEEIILSSDSINGSVETKIREVCKTHGVSVRRLRVEIS